MLKERLGYVPAQWLVNAAVLTVKDKMKLKRKSILYCVMVMMTVVRIGFCFNGWMRGWISLFQLTLLFCTQK